MKDENKAAELKKTFSENLNHYMNKSGKNTADIAADLGFPFSTVSDWVHGKKYPRMDKVQSLADYFGIAKSDLTEKHPTANNVLSMPGSPYKPSHRIPILGRVSAGLPLYAEEHIEGYTYTELNGGAEYFALRVQGDSMNALRINDGDVLIVRRQEEVEDGEIAVVLVDGEDATVKRFYRDGRHITLMPQSTNPQHQPQRYDLKNIKIKVLGKVVRNQIDFE